LFDDTTVIIKWFAESDYDEFTKKTTIKINGGSEINFGQDLETVDSGEVTIETVVAEDGGESTTVCTRTSKDGENVNCGNCTNLTCQFTVTETTPADVITVHIVIHIIQDSSIDFNVYVKGMLLVIGYFA